MKVQVARIAPNQIPSNDLSMLQPEAILATWNLPADAQVINVTPVYLGYGAAEEASYDVSIQSDSYAEVDAPVFFTPDIDPLKVAAYRAAQGWS
jgi:hypothetical protein